MQSNKIFIQENIRRHGDNWTLQEKYLYDGLLKTYSWNNIYINYSNWKVAHSYPIETACDVGILFDFLNLNVISCGNTDTTSSNGIDDGEETEVIDTVKLELLVLALLRWSPRRNFLKRAWLLLRLRLGFLSTFSRQALVRFEFQRQASPTISSCSYRIISNSLFASCRLNLPFLIPLSKAPCSTVPSLKKYRPDPWNWSTSKQAKSIDSERKIDVSFHYFSLKSLRQMNV